MKNKCILSLLAWLFPLFAGAQTGILDFHPADEVVPLLEAARSRAVVWGRPESAPALTLLHFSDLHGDGENLSRIAEFRRAYGARIEDAIHLGDAVACYWDDPNPWDQVPEARGILNVVGNHDCWKGHLVWAQTHRPYDATPEEAYSLIMEGKDASRPFIEEWGVVYTPGLCYYYKDYSAQKIRLVVLDCMHYDAAQHVWFEKVLEEARLAGFTVVAAQQYPAQSGLDAIPGGFSDRDESIGPEPSPAPGVQMERMADEAFAAVDAFLEKGGDFACWLGGHTHLDFIGHIPGHGRQLQIIADKAGFKDDYMQEARPRGTRFQDAFNLVTINPGRSMVSVQRIGCNRDQYLRSKTLFCYDYRSGTILVNE
ncbi:MAG: metallophosphoesterase [Bacteroidales bacterium]|nr:metallophosphoesterase [Bacteroidales bacterium]